MSFCELCEPEMACLLRLLHEKLALVQRASFHDLVLAHSPWLLLIPHSFTAPRRSPVDPSTERLLQLAVAKGMCFD